MKDGVGSNNRLVDDLFLFDRIEPVPHIFVGIADGYDILNRKVKMQKLRLQ